MFTNFFSEDLFDDDEPEPIPGDPRSTHQLLLNESLHPSDDEPFWTDFLARAKGRQGSRVRNLPEGDDEGDRGDSERGIEPADDEEEYSSEKPLWVVVVKVGQLISMAFLVAHPPSPATRNIPFFEFTSV